MAFFLQLRAWPNLLTLLRLFIIPYLVLAILDQHYPLAFGFFFLAGVSDGLDGLLARKLKQHTTLGLYLDPIADKLLLSTLFIVLTHVGLIPRYVTVLVFSRDFGILLIATLLFATNTLRDFRPSLLGKLNTAIQIITLTFLLADRTVDWAWPHWCERPLFYAVAILAPLSAAHYAWLVVQRMGTQQVVATASLNPQIKPPQ